MLAHFASSSLAVAATLWLLVAFSVAWTLVIAKATQFIRAARVDRRTPPRSPRSLRSERRVLDSRGREPHRLQSVLIGAPSMSTSRAG